MGKLTKLQRDALAKLERLSRSRCDGFFASEIGHQSARICRMTLAKKGLVKMERSNHSDEYYHLRYSITPAGRAALSEGEP